MRSHEALCIHPSLILTPLSPLYDRSQVLVDLANLQDSEVGDGTTSVVILAAELLKNAGDLVKQKVSRCCIVIGTTGV